MLRNVRSDTYRPTYGPYGCSEPKEAPIRKTNKQTTDQECSQGHTDIK